MSSSIGMIPYYSQQKWENHGKSSSHVPKNQPETLWKIGKSAQPAEKSGEDGQRPSVDLGSILRLPSGLSELWKFIKYSNFISLNYYD